MRVRDLSAFVESPSFVRSFAYATGPAYGLLLDDSDPGWHRRLATGRRMDLMLATALRLPAPTLHDRRVARIAPTTTAACAPARSRASRTRAGAWPHSRPGSSRAR